MAGEIFMINIIPIVVSIIATVNAINVIKQAKEYLKKPANTPFGPVQKAQGKMIAFLVVYLVLGLNFFAPMLFAMLAESTDSAEDGAVLAVMLQFLLIVFYIVSFILVIIALVKVGEARKTNSKIILNNRGTEGMGANWNTVIAQSNSPLDALNRGRQNQNPNTPNVAVPTMDNTVPEGYEAPPDLNPRQPYSNAVPQPKQYNPVQSAQSGRTAQSNVQPNQRSQAPGQGAQPYNYQSQASVNMAQSPNQGSQPPAQPSVGVQRPFNPPPLVIPVAGTGAAAQNQVLQSAPKPDIDVLRSGDTSASISSTPELQSATEIKSINPFENKGEKRCPNCGVVNPEKNRFCEFCGKEL